MYVVILRMCTLMIALTILLGFMPYVTFSAVMSLFLFVIAWAYIMRDQASAMIWIFLCGLCADVILGTPFGVHVIFCLFLGYVFVQGATVFTHRGEYKIIWGISFAFLLAGLSYGVYDYFFLSQFLWTASFFTLVGGFIVQIFAFAFFMWSLKKIEKYISRYSYKINVKRHS